MRLYHLVSEDGSIIFTNLDESPDYYEFYRRCDSKNEKFEYDGNIYRHGIIQEKGLDFYFLTDEKAKSSRLFKEFRYVYFETLKNFLGFRDNIVDEASKQASRIYHNIVSYNAHTLQAVYSLIPQDQFTRLKTRHLNEIQEILSEKPREAAVTLLSILKNNNLMKAELSIFNKLYEKNPDLNYLDHPIHKIVKLVMNTYWLDFIEKEVEIIINPCTNYVNIDYESFLAAFVHVVENALKYTLPKTKLNIIFEIIGDSIILTLDMVSLQITNNDLDRIFEEGYSGELPVSLNKDGKGIGLYMVNRLMEISNLEFKIYTNCDTKKATVEKGIRYENNQFQFILPLANR